MPTDLLNQFYTAITAIANRGDAREESYYSTLEALFKGYAAQTGRKGIEVRTLPIKTEAGNPDFRIWDGSNQITGYIEAKAPSETFLDVIEESEQLKRYRKTFPNLILTNFFEFRLYRNGDLVETVLAARSVITFKLNKVPPVEKGEELLDLFAKFFSFSMPRTFTAESLAVELAKRTRFLREIVEEQLQLEEKQGSGDLTGSYEAFRDYLIAHLSREDFADLYSQTVTYGLFAARTRAVNGFNRRTAYDYIPNTIGVLKEIFQFISLGSLPTQLEWIIDEIAHVLAVAEPGAILDRFYHEGKGADPVVHFYETFLAQYDPKEREQRGVYYTPPPVVSFIVRSLNHLLKKSFAKANGLASDDVTLLDPAAGTMTFVAKASMEALAEQEKAFGSGGNDEFIRSHLLENFFAFELMIAPYAIGHLKMSFILEELGYRLTDDERFKFYLTNTLEMEELAQTNLPVVRFLAEESHLAGRIKKEQPILVILGNPPYSGISANINDWTEKLLKEDIDGTQSYYTVDGEPLGEKKLWLQDDYVKFLRFAQWKIHKAGQGIVGMITNHSYLDNPTFRGMRQSLMKTFNDIYILDLHGNSLKKEKAPDGGDDKNVFDIRQGVAIGIFIKKKTQTGCRVRHLDLWGLRKEKYAWLESNMVNTSQFEEVQPKAPWYFFVPRRTKGIEHYLEWPKVTDLFPISNVGIVTARDRFAVDFDRSQLKNRIRQFRDLKVPDELIRETFKLKDTSTFKLAKFRAAFAKEKEWEEVIQPLTYRPFDTRYIAYTKWIIERPIYGTMRHMLAGDNLGLIAMRQVSLDENYSHFLITQNAIDNRVFVSSKGIGQLFPLYLHPDENKHYLFSAVNPEKTEANLNPRLTAALCSTYGKEPPPEDIFHYIYAVLYAPTYRERYVEFLKTDFPRVPFTADKGLFDDLAGIGNKLVDLHLLKSAELDSPGVRFDGKGENQVAASRKKGFQYSEEEQRVYINTEQYFHPVPPEVWSYQIGGYQVLEKWLKDRKGRELSLVDIRHYCKVVRALQLTIEIQLQIDALYDDIEQNLLNLEAVN